MPELTEVEITRQKLLPLVRNRKIILFSTDWPRGIHIGGKLIRTDIVGRVVTDIRRIGKVLFFDLSGDPERILAIHLRMSGRLELQKISKSVAASPGERWIRHRWQLSGGRELVFIDPRKFGVIWYGSPDELAGDSYIGSLGEDAAGISPEMFDRALHGTGMIKALLLKQDRISGIGNIIADESLWRARIHPMRAAQTLRENEIRNLYKSIGHVLRLMLARGGTTLRDWGHPDGGKGSYQDVRRVYGRAGLSCRRCRRTLERLIVGGRGTTICPSCQPKS